MGKSRPRAEAAAGGPPVCHEDIVLALRAKGSSVRTIVVLAKTTWQVKIPSSMLEDAPNIGILRMRAANIIRGALVRANRFRGEVYRVSRARKAEASV